MKYAVVSSNSANIKDLFFASFYFFYCSIILCSPDLFWNKFPRTYPSLEVLRDRQEAGEQRITVFFLIKTSCISEKAR